MPKPSWMTIVVASVLASMARPARAQNAQDKAGAEILFEEGKELMKQKKYGLACPKFLESNRLDSGLGTMLWLADCYDKNGQSASAWGEFREAADIAARTRDAREKVARDRSNRLEPTLSRMTILVGSSAVPGMVIKRDGQEVGETLWGEPVPIDPGSHQVIVTAPGKKQWETTVQLLRGVKNFQLNVPALEEAPVAAPVVAPGPALPEYVAPDDNGSPSQAKPQGRSGSGQRAAGGVLAGLGIAGAGLGIFFHFFSQSQLNTSNQPGACPSMETTAGCSPAGMSARETGQTAQTAEILTFIGGGAFLLTGVFLIIAAPNGSPDAKSARVAPWVGPSSGGLTLQAPW